MKNAPKAHMSARDRLAARGFSSEALQDRVASIEGLQVFRKLAKPTQDAHNAIRRRFVKYLNLLNNPQYSPEKVLVHGAPHPPISVSNMLLLQVRSIAYHSI
jgi:hypothetical protein